MQATDLLEVVAELSSLKGFPRGDATAMLAIAEETLRIIRPRRNPPSDEVLLERAERVIRRVFKIATEGWEGPAQLHAASAKIAEELERWDTPPEWREQAQPIQCSACQDTGARQDAPGEPFRCCECHAGEDAGEHVANLNRVMQESRERAARARAVSHRIEEKTFERIREALSE
jgi:hypothetical protein